MKKTLTVLLLALSISLQAQTVKIAAAGNLRSAIEEIKTKYMQANPKSTVTVTIGSSGSLFQQISNGAGYDIFMAADMKFPTKLKEQGMVSGKVVAYAYGKLVLWSNTVDVSKGLYILTDKSVNRIAIAKPEIAPYGKRAVECLNYYQMFDKVKSKIVYADNIAQAGQFAQTGNAEVGILAMSLAFAPDMKGTYYVLDEKSYKPVEQGMVLLKGWQANPEAEKFMKYVLSAECNPIFENTVTPYQAMNKLTGKITSIQQSGAIILVDVDVNGQGFSALLIESASRPVWLQENAEVNVIFKESEVSLAKGLTGAISMRNRMMCTVLRVDRGKILSTVTMHYGRNVITSAITTRGVDSLLIAEGDIIEALVKSNEISLANSVIC